MKPTISPSLLSINWDLGNGGGFNEFIPNEDVHKYFQVSDCVVLYYLTASTPSGIGHWVTILICQ